MLGGNIEGAVNETRVHLSWAEVMIAASVGVMRNVQSLRAGRPPGNGAGTADTWTMNIEGAAGEMAVAKHLGLFWCGAIGDLKADDVGSFQVKTNTSRKYDDLILRPTDPDERAYILVLSFLPDFVICGWIPGVDGKRSDWWDERLPGRPAFFVPRKVLRPMADLAVKP